MIDNKILRESFEETIAKLETRGLPANVKDWPELDKKKRELTLEVEAIRARKNSLGPEIARAKKEGSDASALLSELKESGEREKQINSELDDLKTALSEIELLLPNIPDASVPIGTSEEQDRIEKQWGEKRQFSFQPLPHWEIGEKLNILDFERAAKLSGARFALYRGGGARLERALINFMLDRHREKGYLEVIPPFLVRAETMQGSGQLPKFEEDLFQTPSVDPKLYLIPTSEVALVNMHVDQILAAEDLPLYYTAYTPCFRAEAGSHGRDVRGLIRLHQFNKVELVKVTEEETSYEELESLTEDAESILEQLELPYQRKTLCSGEAGLASAKTYDLEVWLPGQGEYREISSCSNTTDFQSRRTKTRYRKTAKDKPKLAHMLNGSGLAVGRTFLAILENYQQEDGSVTIPQALQPYMNGEEVLGLAKD